MKFSLPHARGGVSSIDTFIQGMELSSPRPWGCFQRDYVYLRRRRVFPTPVGVFPLEAITLLQN